MSRVGRKPIVIPKDVRISIGANRVEVEGPQGKLASPIPPGITFALEGGELVCKRRSDARRERAFHGLARALAQNAVTGVSRGFKKELDIVGVGYRATVEGDKVVFSLGYSHPVEFPLPAGIKVAVDKQNHVVVSGIDRQLVGEVAAKMRRLRKPDPYKQKGIRYTGEVLKKKAGKAGATAGK
jgi:large subunit ribosomal protein L6